MRVNDKTLRSVIRRILLERSDESGMEREPWKPYAGNIVQPPKISSPQLGKKYSYEDSGEPQCVVVAISDSSKKNICTVYSRATIKDPVGEGLGRLLSPEEMDEIAQGKMPFWESFNTEKMSSIAAGDAKSLYTKLGLFVPLDPKRPAFESTTGAHEKTGEMGCALDAKGFARELKRFFASLPPPPVSSLAASVYQYDFFEIARWMMEKGDQESLSRIMPCFKAATTDSGMFGMIQAVIGLLGPLGAEADMIMDAVPGMIVVAYFIHIKQYQLASYYLIQTVVFMFLPAAISKWIGKPVVSFVVGFFGIPVLMKMSEIISIKLLGEDVGVSQSDLNAVIEEIQKKDMTFEDLRASQIGNVFDLQGLQKQYPAL